jgi:predicted dehydrogenase
MLRLAIIGVGWAGTRQAQAVDELNRKVTLACFVDNDPDFLKEKAAEFNLQKSYTDYQAALAGPDIDAVSICTPHNLHRSMAVAAAEAGKHILVEKPMAVTVDEATQMIDAAEANGVKLYVAESASYTPMSKFLREIAQSGQYIGELTFATMVNGFRAQNFGYPGRRAWLAQPDQGGTGTWMLHGIHTMAQLRYIFGEVETVYAQEHKAGSYARTDLEGTMSGLLTMESGVHIAIVQTSETRLPHNLNGFVLYGDRGSVRASKAGCEVFGEEAEAAPVHLDYPAAELSEYALEIEAFADYVAGQSVGPTTGKSERRSLAIVQAGYESARSGQPVNLEERFGEL